ncbi:hypothetical protein [Actinomadura rudentiformis]|uniref:Type II toxin-antitoxin system VapC family toxin n=1 Tax=Actinomadura rudentiformis TaxID=359158 RepID=A0A6H9YRH6_9ACTN|nr:hypothetical protein [Actinomadura rudentiformis]KAB2350308.1 hypothetical protein F8566_11060 [Actinomadura rudentiformis]
MITGHVFDATALQDLATGKTVYVRARLRASIAQHATIVIPAAGLARAWQLVPDHARPVLERLPGMQVVHIDDMDDVIAQQTGLLAATAPDISVDTVQAAWSARWRRWPVLTATPDAYRALPGVRIEEIP